MITIIISSLTIFFLILCIIKFPTIRIKKISFSSFWFVAMVGALLLIIANQIGFKEIFESTKKEIINPLQILILFISVTFISIILEEVGFFRFLANKVAKKANGSQVKLFLFLYFLISFLTIFTSNDIVILTFTPFICELARKTKVNPIPYLIAEFVAANTWSMMLLIGNPTNIYLSLTYNISFLDYFKVMVIPTIAGGLASLGILYMLFRKQLRKKIEVYIEEEIKINKPIMIISLCHLIICTILLAISNFINIEMWIICLIIAINISIILFILNKSLLLNSLKRSPWNLVPFILSMFSIILALDKYSFTTKLGDQLQLLVHESEFLSIIIYGFTSILADNLINNIPMSLAAIKVLYNANLSSVYAVIIGSNLGAYLTPIGALAGIMWMNLLRKENVKLSFMQFIKYGIIVVPIVSIVSLIALYLVIM